MRLALPAIPIVLGATLRLWGIGFGLPHTECRPDERQLLNLAGRIAAGDLNPHDFVWPTLYQYLLAIVFRGQAIAAGGSACCRLRLRFCISRLDP